MNLFSLLVQLTLSTLTLGAGYYFYPEQMELVVVLSALVFVALSYILSRFKQKSTWLALLVGASVFSYFYLFDENMNLIYDQEHIVYHALVALAVCFALLLHANLQTTDVSFGKSLSVSQLRKETEERITRIKKLKIDEAVLIRLVQDFSTHSRSQLIEDDFLRNPLPVGKAPLREKHRSAKGNRLLQKAKDLLYALLYGDAEMNVKLLRAADELLTLTISQNKAYPLLSLLKNVTIIPTAGKLLDPTMKGKQLLTDIAMIELQFTETPAGVVGDGIVACLSLINLLEINDPQFDFRILAQSHHN